MVAQTAHEGGFGGGELVFLPLDLFLFLNFRLDGGGGGRLLGGGDGGGCGACNRTGAGGRAGAPGALDKRVVIDGTTTGDRFGGKADSGGGGRRGHSCVYVGGSGCLNSCIWGGGGEEVEEVEAEWSGSGSGSSGELWCDDADDVLR